MKTIIHGDSAPRAAERRQPFSEPGGSIGTTSRAAAVVRTALLATAVICWLLPDRSCEYPESRGRLQGSKG